MSRKPLYDRIDGAFVWIAAFSFASGVFLSLTLLLRWLPPTAPVAVGLVTIERYSKLRDYIAALLFFLLVPPLTVWLARVMRSAVSRESSFGGRMSFLVPYGLSPLFYLTTGKVGWVLLLPVALSLAGPRALAFTRTRLWFRRLFRGELGSYHALLFAEAVGWLFFRYLVTGKRIAHAQTLVLEIVFVGMFLAIFWAAAIVIARISELAFGLASEEVFRRLTVAALPLVLLPFVAVVWVPLTYPRTVTMVTLLVIALLALRIREPLAPPTARRLAAFVIFPALIYLFSYASTAELSQWIDLFHRGESIGPASDYLRGKVPFRDTFVLHGMLEDGVLDAWLMELFGRSLEVAVARTVVLGGLLGVAIWFLGIALFDSIPLAFLCVAMGSWTTAENNRTFFQVAAVALYWIALQRRSRWAALLGGALAGVALFFSYEIGLYSIAGALAASLLLWVASRRTEWNGLPPFRAFGWFALGVAVGGGPFAIDLAMHGALGDFVTMSFVTIPRIVDAVWSLPFPDLVSTFRHDLNMHTLADFILWEKFHLVVSPLTIAIAAAYFIERWWRRRADALDHALLVLTVFAAVAQRTAFGRAEFRHQYFAAFLIGPLMVLLAVILVRAMREVWLEGGQGTRAFVAALAVAALPLLGVLFWIPDLINARLHDFFRYSARVLRVERDPHAEEVGWRIDDVVARIHELTSRDEPIFDFSNQPAFYFFADRPNPTRFYQVPILSPREFQAETIRDLERARPKVILRRSPELFDQFDGVTNDLRAQAVSAYIDDVYQFRDSVRGVEIWTPKPDARPRPMASYLGLIRVPDEKELIATGIARMVFPAVGSLPGIGDSYWRSNLTMHNPFREPIPITLRYVSGEYGIDRRFTLAPRQTLGWPDIVAGLFGRPGTIGTLWIEYREGRVPVAVLKTSDVAHRGRASLERPLTSRDAATATTASAELAIIGIPRKGSEWRRVNVGVVNVGSVPAAFQISARTRTGKPVGHAVEAGLGEGRLWLVADVEHALGVELDDTMSVRITVEHGTGVAFATIATFSGDSEMIAAVPAEQ